MISLYIMNDLPILFLKETGKVKSVKIDHGWTKFEYSKCSVSCGGGFRSKTRICTKKGDKGCPGKAVITTRCNLHQCRISTMNM